MPVFADAPWTNTVAYEPLTVVINEGNSYTSRQYVPIGIDISNTEYWALSGNYNAQVDAYRQEVKAFDARITTNASGVAENKTGITELQALKHSREFKGAYAVFVSDSWGTRNYGVTTPYMEQMGDMLGMTVANLSVGSTGFIKGGNNNFQSRLQAWALANPTLVNGVDYVMVCGSTNDYANTISEISAAVTQFVNYAVETFPNAQIILIPQFASNTPAYAAVNTTDDNAWRKSSVAMYDAWYNTVMPRARLINNTFFAFGFAPSYYFNNDYVHPTQAGHNYLAKWMVEALTGANPCSLTLANYNPVSDKFSVITVDQSGNMVEEIAWSAVRSKYSNLVWNNGVLTGSLTFSVTPTKDASALRLVYPGFVKQDTGAVRSYIWGFVTTVANNVTSEKHMSALMEDTGKTQVVGDGATAYIQFSWDGGLTAGTVYQPSLNVSMNYQLPSCAVKA